MTSFFFFTKNDIKDMLVGFITQTKNKKRAGSRAFKYR